MGKLVINQSHVIESCDYIYILLQLYKCINISVILN